MSNKRIKAYIIAISIGGLALAIDRFALTESVTAPQEAEAAPAIASIIPDESTDVARVPIPAVPFPKNLPVFDPARNLRDVFIVPSERTDTGKNVFANGQGPKTGKQNQPTTAAVFADQHTLSAVLDDQHLKIAVVDGRWMRIGDAFDDCRLTTISGTVARFQCPDGEAVLDIADAASRIRD